MGKHSDWSYELHIHIEQPKRPFLSSVSASKDRWKTDHAARGKYWRSECGKWIAISELLAASQPNGPGVKVAITPTQTNWWEEVDSDPCPENYEPNPPPPGEHPPWWRCWWFQPVQLWYRNYRYAETMAADHPPGLQAMMKRREDSNDEKQSKTFLWAVCHFLTLWRLRENPRNANPSWRADDSRTREKLSAYWCCH
jgi:hypothetical protein